MTATAPVFTTNGNHRRDLTTCHFTKHALQRALEMALEADELREAYENPDSVRWSVKYENWTYTKGRVTLAVAHDDNGSAAILTILWATPELWAQDAQLPAAPGRNPRAHQYR